MIRKNLILLVAITLTIQSIGISACSNTSSTTPTIDLSEIETNNDETPPEKPDGERPDGGGPGGPPPEGEGPGCPPPDGERPGGPGGNMGSSNIEYKSVNHYITNETVEELSVSSTGADESAVLVDGGANVTLNDVSISKINNNSTGGDQSSFYGVGAATLVTNGTLTINEGTITTNSKGGAGVFAYGNGVANVNGVTINTAKDTSGGIHVAGGGKLTATDVVATTNGESSAAIRSDRGAGTMVVNGGTFTSNGSGSPALYCTADITVNDAILIANGSEGICIEGLNTTTLNSVELTSNMPDLKQNDNTWSVIVYQSMSGDSKIGKGTFNMNEGVLTSKNGGIFYTTNTESEFNIKSVVINTASDFEYLLRATGNQNKRGWGKSGANGAKCKFNADEQEMVGKIIYDSISTLDLNLINGTTYSGEIVKDDSAAGGANSGGYANVTIDSRSEWIVTSDSTVNILTIGDSKNIEEHICDKNGKEVKIVDTSRNVLREGESGVTITVSQLVLQ